jgi:limonene-1,2-epoxide hydrolase
MPETQLHAAPTPTPPTPIEIVEDFFAAARAKDVVRCSSFFSDDVVYQNVPFPADHGRAKAERTLRLFFKLPGQFTVDIHHIAERDGVVLTERTDGVVHPFFAFSFWVCGTFVVKNGRITEWRDYFDVGAFVAKALASPVLALIQQAKSASAATTMSR